MVADEVLDSLTEVVFQTDRHGNWTFLNPAWEDVSGYPVGASLGTPFLDYVHPAQRGRIGGLLAQLLAGGERACRHEMRLVRQDGSTCWAAAHVRPSRASDGAVTGMVGTLSDISQRKRADERLRLAGSVFAHAGEGILVTSAQGNIVDVNAAFERITGYARDEVLGKNPRLLSSGRQDQAFYAQMWQRLKQDGSWSGEVWNRRKSGECYVERLTITDIRDDEGELSHFVGIFSDITSQKMQSEHLELIAHHDPLTGLPNRRLLADRIQQSMTRARRAQSSVAIAYIDLDGFKAINDRHGHETGDQLLVALARRIEGAVRETDTACRLGGDEFVVVFDNIQSFQACRPMLVGLLDAIAEPVSIDGCAVQLTASMGISLYPQNEEVGADQLVRQADQAMYQAKMAGKNRFCLFDSLGYRNTLERVEEIAALGRALEQGEFVLHYQPIVHLRTGALHSVEALLRWQHPVRGCLSPAAFLPALEGHPLMLALENWVLEEAMRQHVRWLDAGLDLAISVNMSGAQLHRKDFVSHLETLLAAHPRVKARRIKLEVLETSALDDLAHVSRLIADCGELGVSFSIDDFGTGYSSLRYLKQLPARQVKIDQSFVRGMTEDPDDLAILEGVIGMAAAFKREVIAEGVETMLHADMLVRLGCVLAQGYGIARPMAPEALPAWARQWRLPSALSACTSLERGDTLLLKALVEHRSWQRALLAHVEDHNKPLPAARASGLSVLDEWRHLRSPRRLRCEQLVDVLWTRRTQLEPWIDRIAAMGASGASPTADELRRFEQVDTAFVSALRALVDD